MTKIYDSFLDTEEPNQNLSEYYGKLKIKGFTNTLEVNINNVVFGGSSL